MPVLYGYALLMRPPMPGSVPRDRLVSCSDVCGTAPSGHSTWGYAIYSRKLTAQEITHYELEELPLDYVYPV